LLGVAIRVQGAALFGSTYHLYTTVAITVAFSLVARLARGVDTSGALAGAMMTFIMAGRDLRMFWMLLLVFFVTLAATRVGASHKYQLETSEAESGRSATQVMSNLGVAALALTVPSFAPAYLLALAALAEVAADTTSSEIGTAWPTRTVLITTWRTISSGTDGGISFKGTAAGVAAAAIAASGAAGLGLASGRAAWVIGFSGVSGMLVDSVLGATLEQRGYLDNNIVNLLGTAAASLVMWSWILWCCH
jgi:uncharacterized protein (TIGR00297 family)